MTRDRLSAAALLVAAVLVGRVTGGTLAALVLAAVLLGAAVTRARAALGPTGQGIAMILGGTLGAVLALTLPAAAPGGLARPWAIGALVALGAAVSRLYQRAPAGGSAATLVLGLAALTAAGETRVGPAYTAAAASYLLLGLLALRAGDAGSIDVMAIPRRSLIAAIVVAAIAMGVGRALAGALPPLSTWTQERVAGMIGGDTTGFSDRLWLGALDGMLQSDEVVMRLDGPRVDHLRGAVYDHYDAGRWSVSAPAPPAPFAASGPPPEGPLAIRAILVGGARDRHFLPLGAGGVATRDEGGVKIDRFGTLRAEPGQATAVWFLGQEGPGLPVAAPSPEDLALPADLRPALARLAAEFTAGASAPEAKVEAIARRLRTEYRYSLHVERPRRDPLLDFLLEHREGHCEYFASAMALLARAAGVPARVAAGYRVVERNALGGHYVVRERNAHAWAEVHLGSRGWRTVDATPAADAAAVRREMGLVGSLCDLAAAWWASARASRLPFPRALAALALAIAALAVARRIWKRRARAAPGGASAALDPPPPSLARLLDALARRGAVRSPAEPLERFARRLDAPDLADASALLRRYAALRYGGVGDPDAIARAMDGCAARLAR